MGCPIQFFARLTSKVYFSGGGKKWRSSHPPPRKRRAHSIIKLPHLGFLSGVCKHFSLLPPLLKGSRICQSQSIGFRVKPWHLPAQTHGHACPRVTGCPCHHNRTKDQIPLSHQWPKSESTFQSWPEGDEARVPRRCRSVYRATEHFWIRRPAGTLWLALLHS